MIQFFFAMLFQIINSNCKSDASSYAIEVIEYNSKQYYHNDTNLIKPFWNFSDKIWFWDSLAIEEVRELNITEEYKGASHKSYDIRHYRFCDLRKKSVYEFCTFEENPQFLRKYSFNDSLPVIGGWGFNFSRKFDKMEKVIYLTDTLINNRVNKRATIIQTINNIPYEIYCLFDCSRKGTCFDLSLGVSEKVGCPLVYYYYSSPLRKGLHMTSEVNLLRNHLTEKEEKVFNAWKKYAEMNPVK
jgi:hypothetical protein